VQHPCPSCSKPAWGRLCRACWAASKPPPQPRRADLDNWREKQRRAAAVREWINANGMVCPGWQRPAHEAAKLTADHPTEVALGGDPYTADFLILCMSCNSAKSNIRRAVARRLAARVIDTSRDW